MIHFISFRDVSMPEYDRIHPMQLLPQPFQCLAIYGNDASIVTIIRRFACNWETCYDTTQRDATQRQGCQFQMRNVA